MSSRVSVHRTARSMQQVEQQSGGAVTRLETALNILLYAAMVTHVLVCPHTKVEESFNLQAGVICLYRYFEIFLLVLISFPTAKSFLQRIFTPKKIFSPSGHKITYKSYISS